MNRKFKEFQTQCLCGGHILTVDQSVDTPLAEQMGAVGVVTKDGKYEEIFRRLTVHPFINENEIDAFTAAYTAHYGDAGPGYYVLSRNPESPLTKEHPVFLTVQNVREVQQAIQSGAIALLCERHEAVRSIASFIRVQRLSLPLFFRTNDPGVVASAMASGANGSVIDTVSTLEEMDQILDQTLNQPSTVYESDDKALVGVLALQGDYLLHYAELLNIADKSKEADVALIRTPEDLRKCNGVLLPGGWSTLLGTMIVRSGMDAILREQKSQHVPIVAVCASMIIAGTRPGKNCENRPMIGLTDVTIDNNILNYTHDVELVTGQVFAETFSNGPIARDLGSGAQKYAWLKNYPDSVVSVMDGSVSSFAYHKGFQAALVTEAIRQYRRPGK
ncbi:MAG: pyridoxal phosphate synthase yaaE subunit [Candidatus Peregrinibacteria bacterium Greene0416_19]|nr:MAG: pyridoxal phosphate synthase yaaE subunit [Candidatus Peregrinibacteria bacterium Greene0416_19]